MVTSLQTLKKHTLVLLKRNNVDDEDLFYSYLCQNNFSFITYHRARLTKFEINDIKINGMTLGGKHLLIKKIENLPSCCDDIKPELLSHVCNLYQTQADGLVYSYFGNLHLANDAENDNVFGNDWGGESIYNYYDFSPTPEKEKIRERLRRLSKPCVVILRYSADIYEFLKHKRFYEKFMNNDLSNIVGTVWVEKVAPEVIDVVDLSQYSGIDFT